MRITLFILLLCSFFPSRVLPQSELLRKEIEKIIKYENAIDYSVVPGVLIGIIDEDSTFQFKFGRNINPDGVFEIGSVTKPVVAWITNHALRSLNMDRFASVCTFLPDSLCIDSWKNITYDQIIEHKAGLPRLPPGIGTIEGDVQDPYKDYSIDMLARDINLIVPKGGHYSYSHVGFAMMHWLFEKVGGMQSFTKQITMQHNMDHTDWFSSDNNFVQGHGLDGRPQPPWNTNALMPAIGLRSSLDDMMQFVNILFDGYERNQERREPGRLKRELRSLRKTGAYKVVDGWFVISTGKSLVFYHNGRTGGHHISVAFTPHLRKGVIIISNGAMGSNDLSLLILRMITQAKRKGSN